MDTFADFDYLFEVEGVLIAPFEFGLQGKRASAFKKVLEFCGHLVCPTELRTFLEAHPQDVLCKPNANTQIPHTRNRVIAKSQKQTFVLVKN